MKIRKKIYELLPSHLSNGTDIDTTYQFIDQEVINKYGNNNFPQNWTSCVRWKILKKKYTLKVSFRLEESLSIGEKNALSS